MAVAGSLCTAGEGGSSLLGGLLTAAFGFRSAYLVAACGMVAGAGAAFYYMPSDAELAAGRAADPVLAAAAEDAQGDAAGKQQAKRAALLGEAQAGATGTGGATRPIAQVEMKRRSGRRPTDGGGIEDAPDGAGGVAGAGGGAGAVGGVAASDENL